MNDLHGLPIHGIEGRSPYLVATNDFGEASFEDTRVERAAPVNDYGMIVKRRKARAFLGTQPNLFLSQRQRRRLAQRPAPDSI